VTAAAFARDHAILDKIIGGFTLTASVKAIESDFTALKAQADHAHLVGLTIAQKGTPTFDLSVAQAKGDGKLLKAIHGGYVVDVHSKTGVISTGHGNRLTIHDVAGHDKIWANGADERFVFASGFGEASVGGVDKHLAGKAHDTFAVEKSEFANFAALLDGAHQSGHAVVIDGKHGDRLTLDNVTMAELRHVRSDFAFV
jgi:hypothetical protein